MGLLFLNYFTKDSTAIITVTAFTALARTSIEEMEKAIWEIKNQKDFKAFATIKITTTNFMKIIAIYQIEVRV